MNDVCQYNTWLICKKKNDSQLKGIQSTQLICKITSMKRRMYLKKKSHQIAITKIENKKKRNYSKLYENRYNRLFLTTIFFVVVVKWMTHWTTTQFLQACRNCTLEYLSADWPFFQWFDFFLPTNTLKLLCEKDHTKQYHGKNNQKNIKNMK